MSKKMCTLFEGSRERVESQLRGDCSRAPKKEISGEALSCTLIKWENCEGLLDNIISLWMVWFLICYSWSLSC